MSDAIKNLEIEDVLSSIRRLVSDAPAKGTQEPSEKLVLTPALRVAVDASAETAEPGKAWEEISLEDRIAELEAAVAKSGDDWEPDGSEVKHEVAEKIDPLTVGLAKMRGESIVAPIPPAPTATSVAVEGPAVESDAVVGDVAAADEATQEPVETIEGTAEAGPEIASETVDEGGTPFDGEGDIENLLQDTDTVLDEDTLRDMIAEIVRQELQGALGERITRNVRKLVRREINRALVTRDFD